MKGYSVSFASKQDSEYLMLLTSLFSRVRDSHGSCEAKRESQSHSHLRHCLGCLAYVSSSFAIRIALHTERSSHICPRDLTLERQNNPASEAGTVGDPVPQHLHGNHGGRQSRRRKHQPWPS